MQVLLIQPEWKSGAIGFRLAAMPEPLGLEMLAAVMPGHDVRILDMRVDGDLEGCLARHKPDVVGVTSLTTEVYAAREVVRTVRRLCPEAFTVVGGHHASLIPQDFFLPEVDAISLGEGEINWPGLLEAVEGVRDLHTVPNLYVRANDGHFHATAASTDELDMDKLPIPRRDLTSAYRNEYFFLFDKPDTSVATGRGCPYHCNFCSVWRFYNGRTRQMSAGRVIDHIEAVTTDHITFVDDNFLMNYRRESEIADLIRAKGIRKRYSMECRTDSIVRHPELVTKWVDVGLYAVLLGLEGAGDDTLKSVNKKNTAKTNDEAIRILQDHGVIIWGAFLVDPAWDVDDFKRLADYVHAKQITHTQFTVLTPLPGTDLHDQKKHELLTDDYRCYDALHAVLPTKLPREEFYRQFADLYRQSDLSPYYDLVRAGKLTIDNCRHGKAMLDAMSVWQHYLPGDPILGQRDKTTV